ncbi:CtsR family transcriptional regulator [Caldicellulosiruptoraceae bacterium PP1]
MAKLSDIIETFIKELLNSKDGEIEIQRNELAQYFKCAPSQINYVLSTRFTLERGYYIESKRGGGGSIRIMKISIDDNNNFVENLINSINNSLTQHAANSIIDCLYENNFVTEREALLMKVVTNDKTLNIISDNKDEFRAFLLKNMIINLLNN